MSINLKSRNHTWEWLHVMGWSNNAIGRAYGRSGARVGQVVKRFNFWTHHGDVRVRTAKLRLVNTIAFQRAQRRGFLGSRYQWDLMRARHGQHNV